MKARAQAIALAAALQLGCLDFKHGYPCRTSDDCGDALDCVASTCEEPPDTPVSVTVTGADAPPIVGATLTLTAAVSGTREQTVLWTINGAQAGEARARPLELLLFKGGLFSATARSVVDLRARGGKDIVVPDPVLAIVPATATLQIGERRQFTLSASAIVNYTVRWSLEGNYGNGRDANIDYDGTFNSNSAGTYVVHADVTSAGVVWPVQAQVTVQPPPAGLQFVSQPADALVGAPLGDIVVEAVDQAGKADPRVPSITVSVWSPTGYGWISTASANTVGGVATVSGLQAPAWPGTYELRATGPWSYPPLSATSTRFDASCGSPGPFAVSGTVFNLVDAGLVVGDGLGNTFTVPAGATSFSLGSYPSMTTLTLSIVKQPSPQTCPVPSSPTRVIGCGPVTDLWLFCQ